MSDQTYQNMCEKGTELMEKFGPGLVEWCSSCADTRVVKLVLSEEIKVLEVETSCDACTQTPRQKPRRRGGQGSRRRRMLSYQLMLTVETFEQPEDRRQVYQGRAAGGVYLATLEGEGGGDDQGGEARGGRQA